MSAIPVMVVICKIFMPKGASPFKEWVRGKKNPPFCKFRSHFLSSVRTYFSFEVGDHVN